MRTAAALLSLLLSGTPATAAQRDMDKTDPVTAAADFKGPAGWQRDTGSFGADHFVTFTRGTLRLRVQLFGGKGSRYADAKGFLASPEAKGSDGKTPEASLMKAGKRAYKVYARSNSGSIGPQGLGAYEMIRTTDEVFSLIPHGKRFFVVSLTRTLDVPPEDPLDTAPLKAFLSSFRPH